MEQNKPSLFELLRNCQLGESGVIVGGNEENDPIRKGLYINTKVDELVKSFFIDNCQPDGKLLIVLGSAGDGKSALLVNWREEAQKKGITPIPDMLLDATASLRPHDPYELSLDDFLEKAAERLKNRNGPRSAIAINQGLAINFFNYKGYEKKFGEIYKIITEGKTKEFHESDGITVINLSRRRLFDTSPEHLGEGFLLDLIQKFDFSNPVSPFHDAYEIEKTVCGKCLLCYNAKQMENEVVRRQLARLMAARSLMSGSHLNPRLIIHTISSALLHPSLRNSPQSISVLKGDVKDKNEIELGPEHIIWNSIYDQNSSSEPNFPSLLDPTAQANPEIDFKILKISSSKNIMDTELKPMLDIVKISGKNEKGRLSTLMRMKYLTGSLEYKTAIESKEFIDYLATYSLLKYGSEVSGHKQSARTLSQVLKKALRSWAGSVDDSHLVSFVDGRKSAEFELMSRWEDPDFITLKSSEKTKAEMRPGTLWAVLSVKDRGNKEVSIPLSFEIYLLMQNVTQGYNPSSLDLNRSEGIQLIASRLSEFTNKKSFVQILEKDGDRSYILRMDEFESIAMERVK